MLNVLLVHRETDHEIKVKVQSFDDEPYADFLKRVKEAVGKNFYKYDIWESWEDMPATW